MVKILSILLLMVCVADAQQVPFRRQPRLTAAAGGAGGYTFAASNHNFASASATTITAQLTSVAAGNTIVVWAGSEGVPTTISVSDGTTTFSNATRKDHSNNDLYGQFCYLNSSVASGTITYTVTFGAARSFRRMTVMRFTHTGTSTFDAEATGGGGENTSVTTHTSGTTLTTTGTADILVANYFNYSGETIGSLQINGVSAIVGPLTGGGDQTFFRIVTATVSSAAATGTTGAGATSVVSLMALKDN